MKRNRKSKKRLLSSNRVPKSINLSEGSGTTDIDISISAEANDTDISLQTLVNSIPADTQDTNNNFENDDFEIHEFEDIQINDANTEVSADVQITCNCNAKIPESIDVPIDSPENNSDVGMIIPIPISSPTSINTPSITQIQVDITNSASLTSPILYQTSQMPGTQIDSVSAITSSILTSIIANTYVLNANELSQLLVENNIDYNNVRNQRNLCVVTINIKSNVNNDETNNF
ncbi:10440_t:CDS:2 [Racocetra fulgida]|uniref:10440_t:CDS:1 n=1 Tax=Racocetra fulgida TaxID=60492 RepID=A0A9N8ZLJ8_9GLOM|nr:10440_t:CDS:2 [Racocetra fulgida]